jgi:lipooligosaccharide transport system ATP-binding protein
MIYGRYFGLSRKFLKGKIEELLEFAQLVEKRNNKTEELSGGMKRRLTIARGLVNEPEILMLDEPTTGLDPQARHILWDRLFRLKELGVTLVITTYYMDEAEQLCDRLMVMDKGKIMAEGSPAELIKRCSSKEVLEVRFGSDNNAAVAEKIAGVGERLEILPDRILVYAENGEKALEEIVKKGLHPVTSLVRRSSLEDVFLRLTGRTLVD